ncbi:MAG: S41 family peptidase, partial [Aquincola sp.]|nr:S41 family peptidase [Aquincola sp.]
MRLEVPRWLRALACVLPIVLSACGGGGGGSDGCPSTAASGGVADRQDWLRCYFNDTYFWYRLSPNPSPAGYNTVGDYFAALIYRGGDLIPPSTTQTWPSDRYSGYQSTESFNRFFGDGQTLGYGLAVAGLEVTVPAPIPSAPLYVRYVEPASPAAAASIARGDRVMSLNGQPASDVIAANDFSALTPNAVGDPLTVVLRNAQGVDRSVQLAAAVFALTPVQGRPVVQSPNGRLMGYVFVKDMINQVGAPLSSVMSGFRAQGIQELVLDLRYNGGGLVSVGGTVASYASGSPAVGQTYARLLYNDKQSGNNQNFAFSNPGAWSGFSRVFVLTGPRTCSASEQVINGLRGLNDLPGARVDVVTVGDTTCGKPVGFLPDDDGWGTTYSIVNFESVNARNEG